MQRETQTEGAYHRPRTTGCRNCQNSVRFQACQARQEAEKPQQRERENGRERRAAAASVAREEENTED
jgi:hypothetical protein